MYQSRNLKNSRIEVADALRGLAVAGIILFHSVEHFNMFSRGYTYSLPCDDKVFSVLQLLLSGKMYGIFAMLFGLSFFIMRDNQEQKGKDFSLRFAWRMVLLFGFGMLNTVFYDGDILVTYAILGLFMIPAGYLSNRWLWAITILLLIQPLEIVNLLTGWHIDAPMYYGEIIRGHAGSFSDALVANMKFAQKTSIGWFVMKGRITQTLGLFYLGLLFGRMRLFYNEGNNLKVWRCIAVASVMLVIAGSFVKFGKLNSLLSPIYSLFILMMITSVVVLLWYRFQGFRNGFEHLGFFGRMSLTNYLLQSIFGSVIFYGWGLGMYKVLGTTYAALVGVGIILLQYGLMYLWSKRHKRGPLEELWRKLTWIGA